VLTPQLSILRATVAFNAMPEKERVKHLSGGELISYSTLGEVFKSPQLIRFGEWGLRKLVLCTFIDLIFGYVKKKAPTGVNN
jgi:hypothetical protein